MSNQNKIFLLQNEFLVKGFSFLKKTIVIYVFYPFRARFNFKQLKTYFKHNQNNSDEFVDEAIGVLSKNNRLMIPFRFIEKYEKLNFEISCDGEGYPYIKINNNHVYFPKNTKNEHIIDAVRTHYIEQDIESPHCYVPVSKEFIGHTAVLVGASDGLLALELLSQFEHIYLIESDINWIEPLTKTFNSCKEKITIINAFASDTTSGNQKKLDDIFKDYNYPINFLQADVEGAAYVLLKGAEAVLKQHLPKLAFACYHYHNEANEIKSILDKFNYSISFSQKFVYMWMEKNLPEPYFRKGVLYAEKN